MPLPGTPACAYQRTLSLAGAGIGEGGVAFDLPVEWYGPRVKSVTNGSMTFLQICHFYVERSA